MRAGKKPSRQIEGGEKKSGPGASAMQSLDPAAGAEPSGANKTQSQSQPGASSQANGKQAARRAARKKARRAPWGAGRVGSGASAWGDFQKFKIFLAAFRSWALSLYMFWTLGGSLMCLSGWYFAISRL